MKSFFVVFIFSVCFFFGFFQVSEANERSFVEKIDRWIEQTFFLEGSVSDYPLSSDLFCPFSLSTEEIERKVLEKAQREDKRYVSMLTRGITFTNENLQLLDLFRRLTIKQVAVFDRSSMEYSFSSKCTKVLCAVKEIFGPDVGPRLLFILQEYGFNASHLAYKGYFHEAPKGVSGVFMVRSWTKGELDVLLESFADLPKAVLPRVSFLVRYNGDYFKDSLFSCTTSQAIDHIMFFDCWERQSRTTMKLTLTHELGHGVGRRFHNTNQWMMLSGWDSEGEESCFVSDYAKIDFMEDFAETFVAYRYIPHELKSRCPKKYAFFKEQVFGGMEFTRDGDQAFCE